MKRIQKLEFQENSREELLPGFDMDFPYIATCAEFDKYREPKAPWHWHRAVELFFMESGTLEYTTPKGKWVFPAGSGGFVNSNVLHTSRVIPSGQETVQKLHLFDPTLLSGTAGSRMERKYVLPLLGSGVEVIPLDPADPEQAETLKQIRRAFEVPSEEWGYEFRLREALTKIWLRLAAPATEQASGLREADDKIKTLMIYIHEHHAEDLSVEQLAEAAHISKRACFRLFRENLHMSPLEYIRSYRLQMASRMLLQTNEPVTRIGYACGLGSGSYFGKVFREHFGCSPAEFRRRWHNRDNSERK